MESRSPASVDIEKKIDDELHAYNLMDIPFEADVVQFWMHIKSLKVLPIVAKKWLLLPISSADAERSFSLSTKICSPSRNRLHPDTISSAQFVYSNSYLFE